MSELAKTIQTILRNIEHSSRQSAFQQNVRFVAVSKTKPVELIKEAYDCGIRDFGENYVEELVEKSSKLPQDIRWHFIGHLQTNKCKKILIPNLHFLETIDSIKLAQKVDKGCESLNKKDLNVFIQVRTSDEDTKSGVEPDSSYELIEFIRTSCPNLNFSGLMTIGAPGDLKAFKEMVDLREKVCQRFSLQRNEVELSMGMSSDYEEAVLNFCFLFLKTLKRSKMALQTLESEAPCLVKEREK